MNVDDTLDHVEDCLLNVYGEFGQDAFDQLSLKLILTIARDVLRLAEERAGKPPAAINNVVPFPSRHA